MTLVAGERALGHNPTAKIPAATGMPSAAQRQRTRFLCRLLFRGHDSTGKRDAAPALIRLIDRAWRPYRIPTGKSFRALTALLKRSSTGCGALLNGAWKRPVFRGHLVKSVNPNPTNCWCRRSEGKRGRDVAADNRPQPWCRSRVSARARLRGAARRLTATPALSSTRTRAAQPVRSRCFRDTDELVAALIRV
jgi:hypothetical protein